MGDPAGIGPEIVAACIGDAAMPADTAAVVVGHQEILEQAAAAMRVRPKMKRLENPERIREDSVPGSLNLVHLDNIDMASFRYGEVQAMCGRASFDCLKAAVDLALEGRVDALATTPLNKESLKAASVPFIGHTEILASLTGTRDPLTMFQVFNLRIFFLTRHVSLRQACDMVTKERLLDYIPRCLDALKQLGIRNPSLVVAGLNPHCGEHGLFGTEEDEFITPAVNEARERGFNVSGPNPADSVFHFAAKGAWDAVLSLYHDQGHIAAKMTDFERTISLTLGLPFLRTSVDHGTAFDIAGKGKASPVSMVEAVRLAALYADNIKNAHRQREER